MLKVCDPIYYFSKVVIYISDISIARILEDEEMCPDEKIRTFFDQNVLWYIIIECFVHIFVIIYSALRQPATTTH